jgi:recombinational DNA repair ATPase RecF
MATASVGISKPGAPKKPADPARLLGRRARLLDALKRADGERKDTLEAELATIEAELAELRAALAAALDPPAEG